jgi:hypothetical protein
MADVEQTPAEAMRAASDAVPEGDGEADVGEEGVPCTALRGSDA